MRKILGHCSIRKESSMVPSLLVVYPWNGGLPEYIDEGDELIVRDIDGTMLFDGKIEYDPNFDATGKQNPYGSPTINFVQKGWKVEDWEALFVQKMPALLIKY